MTLLAISHPPPSQTDHSTHPVFLDEFTDYMENFLTTNHNIVIEGDFNLHTDNKKDPEAQLFTDMMAALGTYLSDHCTIECLLSLKKSNMQKKEIKYRKLNSIDPTAFSQHPKLDGYEELALDDMIEVLDKNLQDAIDATAPIKSRTILVRTTNPWFNNEVRDQKRRVRNQEKKWRKYKLQSNWKVFKSERLKYRQMLREVRRVKIAEEVNGCGNNVKKLYNLVNHLMCGNVVTPFAD